MYLLVRCFKEVAVGFMAVFFINLFIGLNTTACSFLLRLFSGADEVRSLKHLIPSSPDELKD